MGCPHGFITCLPWRGPRPKDLSLPDSAVNGVPNTGDSGDWEGNQAKLSQVGEKRLNPGCLEPTRAGGWRCLLEGRGRRGEAWVSSLLTQDKWGDPLALPFPRQSLPAMETCRAKSARPRCSHVASRWSHKKQLPLLFPLFLFFLSLHFLPFSFSLPLYFPFLFLSSFPLTYLLLLFDPVLPTSNPPHPNLCRSPHSVLSNRMARNPGTSPACSWQGHPASGCLLPCPGVPILEKKWVV